MFYRNLHTVLHVHVIMYEIETWAPGSAAHALCVINISSHETGAQSVGAGPGPHGPPPGSAPAIALVLALAYVSLIVSASNISMVIS